MRLTLHSLDCSNQLQNSEPRFLRHSKRSRRGTRAKFGHRAATCCESVFLVLQPSNDSFKRRGNHMEQREKLGLTPAPKVRSNPRQSASEPTTALQKVEVEKAKQDDGLDDLSNILGDLKVMAVDMGSEIEREWRQSGGHKPGSQSTSQPVRDPLPSPTFSASRKRQKTSQLVPSLSLPPQTSFPSIQAANRGSLPVLRSKKPISQPLVNAPSKSTQYPCTISSGRGQLAN